MIRQFLFGGAISAVNIGLHAMVMTLLIRVAQIASERSKAQASQHLVLVMIPTVLVLMVTHALEVLSGPSAICWSARRPRAPTGSISPS